MNEPAAAQFIDNPHAPEFFVSHIAGGAYDDPNVHLTFASTRVSHQVTPGPTNTVVNLRIVMSIPAAVQMAAFLQEFLSAARLNATQKPAEQPMQ
jgi:hypothetical protein